MENVIKNFQKLEQVGIGRDVLEKLDYAAKVYLRHARITFKIVKVIGKELTIETRQDKNPTGNYADRSRLVEITKEWLAPMGDCYTFKIGVVPYTFPPVDVVDSKWIQDRMNLLKISLKTLCMDTGVDKTSMSAYINGHKPLSQTVRSMFFYYFAFVVSNKKEK